MTDSEGPEKAAEPTRVTRGAEGDKGASGGEAVSGDVTQLQEPRAPGDVSPNDLSLIEESPEAARPDAGAGGRRLSHYEIVSRIGVGGMGEVYRAKDLDIGRDVAIKRCGRSDPPGRRRAALVKSPEAGGVKTIESLDGRHVYFVRRYSNEMDPENAIWRIPVEGGDDPCTSRKNRTSCWWRTSAEAS